MNAPALTTVHYDLTVAVSASTVKVCGTVCVRNDGAAPAPVVELWLNPAVRVGVGRAEHGGEAVGETVASGLCAGGEATRLSFATPLLPGQTGRYHFDYTVQAAVAPDYLAGDGCCLRGRYESLWLPVAPTMAATFRLQLTVPEGWIPVLPGAVLEPGEGPGAYTARIGTPCADLDLLLGSWQAVQADGVVVYHNGSDPDGVALVAEIAGRSSAFYGEWFGRPAPRPFVVAQLPDTVPAVVNTGLVAIPGALFRPENPLRTINMVCHEVAHTWWGGLVHGADPGCQWLVEALAHYAQLAFVEDCLGIPLVQQLEPFAAQIDGSLWYDKPLAQLRNSCPEEWTALRIKGTLFLYHLACLVGPNKMTRGFRALAHGERLDLEALLGAFRVDEDAALQGFVRSWLLEERPIKALLTYLDGGVWYVPGTEDPGAHEEGPGGRSVRQEGPEAV